MPENTIRFPHDAPPEIGEMIKIADGIHWIRLPLPMKLDHVNIYALEDGDGWTLIDTGMNSRKTRDILGRLMTGPLQGKPIKRVIVTHHHPDHVGTAGWLQSDHGAELWTTRTAWLFARMLVLDEQDIWPEETLEFYRRAGMDQAFYDTRKSERPFNFADVVAPMPLGFHRISEGDTIKIGQRNWQVRLGNGHAPDHITLWSMDDPIVLAGDQIIAGISSNLGVYATEPNADPVGEWLQSCEKLLPFARPDHLVLPGHKLPFYGLAHRLTQLIDNHHNALERLESFLETPRTAAECFPPLFKRNIGKGEYGLALVEAIGHLNHLHKSGKTTRTLRKDGAWLWYLA